MTAPYLPKTRAVLMLCAIGPASGKQGNEGKMVKWVGEVYVADLFSSPEYQDADCT